jgi:CRP-like cAMP-binding protein
MTDHLSGNLLLDSLAPHTLRVLKAQEKDYALGAVLYKPEHTPEFVFFPHAGAVVSIVRSTEDGWMVEAGVVGSEGLLSVTTIITEPAPTGTQAIVQIEGRFSRIETRLLREHFQAEATFRERCLAFTTTFLSQVTQNLVCNRLHPIEQRLAKWLLIVRDRIHTDDVHLTQEFLAHMLGIHRPGVSIAINALEVDGLLTHTRNHIVLRDHEGLRSRACECYAVLHAGLVQYRTAVAA